MTNIHTHFSNTSANAKKIQPKLLSLLQGTASVNSYWDSQEKTAIGTVYI